MFSNIAILINELCEISIDSDPIICIDRAMNMMKTLRIGCVISMMIISISGSSYAFTFGMLSSDDTARSINSIEETYGISLPMVSFIWDGYGPEVQKTLSLLPETLGTGRIYHITLSPDHGPELAYSSDQVLGGFFDREYEQFFKSIKRTGIKVVFRTMHEMNGGRYPWSGDPTSFKLAWKHIYKLSRDAGLDQSQILFDFSVNGWDMPVADGSMPHQGALLLACDRSMHKKSGCITREDYYPGDTYVDLMGVTFFNWGKATSDRQRLTPAQIMDEPRFDIRKRLVATGKPIIVDEVGTTSVRYQGSYDRNTSVLSYESKEGSIRKNIRLQQLAARALSKSDLVAMSYFNVDATQGLGWENPGEADRSVIDLVNDRYYGSIMEIYKHSSNDINKLFVEPKIFTYSKPKKNRSSLAKKLPIKTLTGSITVPKTPIKISTKKFSYRD